LGGIAQINTLKCGLSVVTKKKCGLSVENQSEYKSTVDFQLVTPFKQGVNLDGYLIDKYVNVIQDFKGNIQRSPEFAIVDNPDSPSARYKSFKPFVDEPELVFRFANLGYSPSHTQIVAYANEYGLLGRSTDGYLYIPDESPKTPKTGKSVEFLSVWYEALRAIRPLTELWQAVINNDTEYLKTHIVWNSNAVIYRYIVESWEWSDVILSKSLQRHQEAILRTDKSDLVTYAKMHIAKKTNANFKDNCSPSVLYKDLTYQKAEIGITCLNMLGVLWFQLAKAVQGNREVLRCEHCGDVFMSTSKQGSPRKYCSGTCKSQAHLHRKSSNNGKGS